MPASPAPFSVVFEFTERRGSFVYVVWESPLMRSTIEVEDFDFQGLRDTCAHPAPRSTRIGFTRRARLPLDPGSQWDPEHEPRGPRALARGLCAARARHHERLGAEQPVPGRPVALPSRRNAGICYRTWPRPRAARQGGRGGPTRRLRFEFQELTLLAFDCQERELRNSAPAVLREISIHNFCLKPRTEESEDRLFSQLGVRDR